MPGPGKLPSRALLIAAGVLNQLLGMTCLVLALASLPIVHDLRHGMQSLIASVIAALAAIVCGTLVWRGRLVPLALAVGIDVGFGIVLPRGGSAMGALLRILPADDASTAETAITIAAIAMFVTAIVCVLAIPSALALRRWATGEIATGEAEQLPPSAASTLRGFAPVRLSPTQVVRLSKPTAGMRVAVIAGVAITVVALGVIVIVALSGGDKAAPAQVAAAPADAAVRAAPADAARAVAVAIPDALGEAPVAQALGDYIANLHAALAKPADLGALLDDKVFAFGIESHEVAEGRDAVVKMLAHDLGGAKDVTARFSQLGQDGDVGWIAEELHAGSHTFVVTAVAGLHGGKWTIAALHWASALSNEAAYRMARDGSLPVPDAIPDSHDDSPLAAAMRAAFASKPSFVTARSARPDAFNFGSAPGERILGGDAIKKTFARIRATIRLHDAVKVGTLGAHGGWGAANVDFTDADRDGTDVTQTFRVLAIWVQEDAGWRIVQTQWSNPQ
jgi:hypothetical protein